MNGRHTFYRTVIVLATLVGAYLLYRLGETVIVLFGAIIFASAIRPYVDGLARRGMNRGLAILLIYAVILGGLAGLLVIAIPPLVELWRDLYANRGLIRIAQALVSQLSEFGWRNFRIDIPVFAPVAELEAQLNRAEDVAGELAWPFARSAGYVVSQLVLALVMGFYWLTARELILDLLLRMSPLRHRAQVELIWNDVEGTLGAYVRGEGILALVIGLASYVGLSLLGVPYAPALAVIAGTTEVIPVVGPILGAIPAVLVGLTVSPTTGLLVVGLYVLIQQLEGNILVPRVMEQSVGLNPLLVIVALVAGSSLNGILGALLAIPVVGALQVVARHLLINPVIENNAPRTESGIVVFDLEEEEGEEKPTIVTPADVRG